MWRVGWRMTGRWKEEGVHIHWNVGCFFLCARARTLQYKLAVPYTPPAHASGNYVLVLRICGKMGCGGIYIRYQV